MKARLRLLCNKLSMAQQPERRFKTAKVMQQFYFRNGVLASSLLLKWAGKVLHEEDSDWSRDTLKLPGSKQTLFHVRNSQKQAGDDQIVFFILTFPKVIIYRSVWPWFWERIWCFKRSRIFI